MARSTPTAGTRRRARWPRVLLALLFLLIVVTGLALALRPWAVDALGRKALSKVEARLGLPVLAETILPVGLYGARLERLRVGPVDTPLVTVRDVRVTLNADSVWDRKPWPEAVDLERVVLHIQGDGTLEGAARALRDALPEALLRRGQEQDEEDAPAAPGGRPMPVVTVTDARVIDAGGALDIREGALTLRDGRVEGTATVVNPPLGDCNVVATREAVELACDKALKVPLPGGMAVRGRAIQLVLQPEKQVRLTAVRITAEDGAHPRLAEMLGGVTADLTATIQPNPDGRHPIFARVVFPGGGAIEARGTADKSGGRLIAEMNRFGLEKLHPSVAGQLSGEVALEADRSAGTVVVEGRVAFTGVKVTHGALAEEAIGPFDLAAEGRIDVEVPPEGPYSKFRVRLRERRDADPRKPGARVRIGDVWLVGQAELDALGELPRIELTGSVPTVPAERLADALPPGLLPHLQPLEAVGTFGFDAKLVLDFAKLQSTVLEAKLRLDRVEIVRMNPDINLESLRGTFTTHFEMPDGETVFDRVTGPGSERWVPLADLPPLLPAAVVAQEDGGFYRHGGVSLFHLRGSLVRNLERGRFVRGGSTLTMQLARNLFLHRKKTLGRKLEELVVTWLLERKFSKDELITLYLNVVEFGEGVFGIRDAARHYFDKVPYALDPVEIGFLVRLLPAPRRWGKQKEKGKVESWYAKRIERLLALLTERGHMTPEQLAATRPSRLWQGDTMDPPWVPPPRGGSDVFAPDDPPTPDNNYGLDDPAPELPDLPDPSEEDAP